jgi:signal transduction histidine kinase/ligand-binding sensor domain-containing protein
MKILIGILHCIFCLFTHAQPPGGIFYHLTVKNGLSSDRVNAVIQDREGFYWIATQDGLNRFDGSNCKVFRNINDDSASLSHNNCIYLLEDDLGDIWVGTQLGVNRYMKTEGKFQRYYLSSPTLSLERVNAIRGITKDKEGNVWIASAGLWQYNIYSRQWTKYFHHPGDPSSIPAGYVYGLQYDKNQHRLWMSSEHLIFFDISTRKFYHKNNNPGNRFRFDKLPEIGFFVLDSTGLIWIFSGNNLFSYSAGNDAIRKYPVKPFPINNVSVDNKKRLWMNYWGRNTAIYDPLANKTDTVFLTSLHQQSPLSAIVTHLYIDRSGNYWISTAKGVNIYNPHAQAVRYFWLPDKRQVKPGLENAISCLSEQNDSVLWTGTGGGLFRYDLAQNKARYINNLPMTDDPGIRCLYLHSESVLWIGGRIDLLLFDTRSEKVIKKIFLNANPWFIMADKQGSVWVGTWFQGLFKFSPEGKLLGRIQQGTDSLRSLRYNGLTSFSASLSDSAFWFGYNFEHGVGRVNYYTHTFENFKIPPPNSYSNISNSVNCIKEDPDGNLWLGTGGTGLIYFDRHKKSFLYFTRNEGLKGNHINCIVQDRSSNTWVTTSNGLSVIDAQSHSITNPAVDLEFSSNDFIANALYRRNGKLLFFCGLKIVEFDPEAYLQPAYSSRIVISAFKVFEKETPFSRDKAKQQNIRLTYNQNSFSFDYSLLKLNAESSTRYAYQLKGFDNDWNYVRERRTAFYTNVPPGNYEFLVKATDESGNWNYFSEPVVIVISPPFWKTWWFYLACGLLIVGATVYFIRNRLKQFKKRQTEQLRLVVATQEQEKKNIAAELHDDLGVRLSALKYFVTSLKKHLQPDNPRSEETYNKAMNVIDDSVEDIRYMLVNLSPKTLNEHGYLIAVEDLVNKLKKLHIIDINLKQTGIEQRLPADMEAGLYRITQELINNTLKHAGATAIHLNIERSDGFIRLQYRDNGKGFHPTATGQGYGMQNIHTRVALLNGKIDWDTEPGKPTSVTIIIPYNHT